MITVRKRLDYILGYLGLGLPAEARAEFALIPPADRETPDVLAVELEIAMAEEAWARVITLAAQATAATPGLERPWIAWAYALREQQHVGDALDILLIGAEAVGKPSPLVDYNLACYYCLLGAHDEARRHLKRAVAREPGLKTEAAADPDLAALHAPRRPAS